MSDVPPGSPAPQPPASDNTGALRVVAVLVMIGSILGLLGTGICFLGFASEMGSDMAGILLLIAPVLLFFAGSVWVCKALLDRLKK